MPLNLDDNFLKGVVTFLTDGRESWICEVLDQAGTNCCWAFATSDAIYSLQHLILGKADKVSVQEFIDRLHLHEKYRPKNAEYDKDGNIVYVKKGYGNSPQNAFDYASVCGIAFDSDWPFKKMVSSTEAEREQLDFIMKNGRRLFLSGYRTIRDGDHVRVREKLREQPVTTLVLGTASLRKWKPAAGVYQGPTDEEIAVFQEALENNRVLPFRNHIMLLVGYGDDASGAYYLAKDSNGEKSGYHGYYKIAETTCRNFVYPVGCKIKEAKMKKGSPSKKTKEKEGGPSKKAKQKKGGPRKKDS